MRNGRLAVTVAIAVAMTTALSPAFLRAQESKPAPNVTGMWKGTRTVTGETGGPEEYKIHSISFDLKQSGANVTGEYKCYAGKKANVDCNNPVGTVGSGTFKHGGIMLKVQAMPNSLQCTFTGIVKGNKMHGRYSCYVGGSFASNGVWDVQRQ